MMAVTAPGMVAYAAAKSDWAARITNDGWGVEATVFYGAMYAAAFFESDVYALVDQALEAMPPGSRFIETVRDMKALYAAYPDDWKRARAEMAQRYYHDEPDHVKSIWNANSCASYGCLPRNAMRGLAAAMMMQPGAGAKRRRPLST